MSQNGEQEITSHLPPGFLCRAFWCDGITQREPRMLFQQPLLLDSVATMRHLFWLSFLAPFPLLERARMSGRFRRYLLVLDRQDMPSRIALTASTRVL